MADIDHMDIFQAVRTRIRDKRLSGIASENVKIGVLDMEDVNCFPGPPGVLLTPTGAEQFNPLEGTNRTDKVGYPVGCVVSQTYNISKSTEEIVNQMLTWRRQIRDQLSHRREELVAAGAPSTTYDIDWVPGRIFLAGEWKKRNLWASAMSFIVWNWELRT